MALGGKAKNSVSSETIEITCKEDGKEFVVIYAGFFFVETDFVGGFVAPD